MIEVDRATNKYAVLSLIDSNSSSGNTITMYNADGSKANSFGNNGSVNLAELTGDDPGYDLNRPEQRLGNFRSNADPIPFRS